MHIAALISYNYNPSFQAKIDTNYFHKKALSWNLGMIARTNPAAVENYFAQMGVWAGFNKGSGYANKFVSYCCLKAAEIFKQLNFILPPKIELEDFRNFNLDSGTTGVCFFRSGGDPRTPIRSVFFNSFAERAKKMLRGKQVEINWENFPLIAADAKDNNWLSSEHYLAPFIHEFAHNLHYHKLYSKYGCPEPNQGYVFNPAVDYLLNKLNEPIAQNNPFVPTSLAIFINDNVGKYAASSLPETFAEIFTQKIVKNLDLFNLKLIRNPFENSSKNNTLDRILEEIWEGLIGDNQGLIR